MGVGRCLVAVSSQILVKKIYLEFLWGTGTISVAHWMVCGSYSILWQSSDISSDRPVSRFQKRFLRFIFTSRLLINLFRVLWAREGPWGCVWDPLTILWHSSDKRGLCYGSNSFRASGKRKRHHARIENWVKLYPKLAQKNNQENSCRDKILGDLLFSGVLSEEKLNCQRNDRRKIPVPEVWSSKRPASLINRCLY